MFRGEVEMNGKYVSRTFVAILLCVTVLWAGDPWKEKASSEWTVKDVEKILKKSPWAQTKKIRRRHVAPTQRQATE